MQKGIKNSDIIYLRHAIEAALDRKFQTPKDFTFLSECIFERQHVNISPTTLKRLWNYLKNEQVVPSRSTLNILSSFLDFNDWDDFRKNAFECEQEEATRIIKKPLIETEGLKPGQILRLYWNHNNSCELEYIEKQQFHVTDASCEFLRPNDRFRCSVIIKNEPLYGTNLQRENNLIEAFVIGTQRGINFSLINKKEKKENKG